jgi:hypothetical protein
MLAAAMKGGAPGGPLAVRRVRPHCPTSSGSGYATFFDIPRMDGWDADTWGAAALPTAGNLELSLHVVAVNGFAAAPAAPAPAAPAPAAPAASAAV